MKRIVRRKSIGRKEDHIPGFSILVSICRQLDRLIDKSIKSAVSPLDLSKGFFYTAQKLSKTFSKYYKITHKSPNQIKKEYLISYIDSKKAIYQEYLYIFGLYEQGMIAQGFFRAAIMARCLHMHTYLQRREEDISNDALILPLLVIATTGNVKGPLMSLCSFLHFKYQIEDADFNTIKSFQYPHAALLRGLIPGIKTALLGGGGTDELRAGMLSVLEDSSSSTEAPTSASAAAAILYSWTSKLPMGIIPARTLSRWKSLASSSSLTTLGIPTPVLNNMVSVLERTVDALRSGEQVSVEEGDQLLVIGESEEEDGVDVDVAAVDVDVDQSPLKVIAVEDGDEAPSVTAKSSSVAMQTDMLSNTSLHVSPLEHRGTFTVTEGLLLPGVHTAGQLKEFINAPHLFTSILVLPLTEEEMQQQQQQQRRHRTADAAAIAPTTPLHPSSALLTYLSQRPDLLTLSGTHSYLSRYQHAHARLDLLVSPCWEDDTALAKAAADLYEWLAVSMFHAMLDVSASSSRVTQDLLSICAALHHIVTNDYFKATFIPALRTTRDGEALPPRRRRTLFTRLREMSQDPTHVGALGWRRNMYG
eukprot:gnl/Dysnectes_brevis/6382_a9860_281.p1 GENE.gnl/Dysnectes_brevis/6382_a9860_281~~gnl/Dysnectes_brevis/6382_a9860_281.p1  ORF type:complete len:589 (-),score=82.66 gnl/Dysnectes_brevis/6382_a9860_281:274-2040(-)